MHHHQHHHAAPPEVTLNGTTIPAAEIAAEMQHHPADTAEAAWQAAAEAVVLRRLLLAEAERQSIDPTPEADETPEEAQVRRLLDRELRIPTADEATCRRWFEANRARFRTKPVWHAAHLLVAADPDDAPARAAAQAQAAAALAEILAAPDRLAALASTHSACPSREQGGDLGLVEAGSTVAEFEAALHATPPGTTHPHLVETRFGFHVLRVLEHDAGRDIPFDMAQPRIAAYLHEAAWRRAAHQYMTLLATRASLDGLTLSGTADGPLVQ